MPPGDYVTRLVLAFTHGLIDRGTLNLVEIRHDATCPCPPGPCECEADILIPVAGGKRVEIDAHGYVRKTEV